MGASCAVPAVWAGGAVEESFSFNADFDAGVLFAESFRPKGHQVVQCIGTDGAQLPETPLMGTYGLMLLSTVT